MKENGAMSNGYDTYLKGTAEIRHYGGLEYHTPSCGKLTYNEVDRRVRSLSDSIQDYLQEHNIVDKICFTTDDRANLIVSYEVSLSGSF